MNTRLLALLLLMLSADIISLQASNIIPCPPASQTGASNMRQRRILNRQRNQELANACVAHGQNCADAVPGYNKPWGECVNGYLQCDCVDVDNPY